MSGTTGEGLDALREALDRVLAQAPVPDTGARVRMWIDRAFSISGAGTVVTGTLGAGVLRPDDALVIAGEKARETVTIRGLQSHDAAEDALAPVTRAAVNLRGIAADDLGRGDVLLTPGAWTLTDTVDVRRATGEDFDDAPRELSVHVGTAAVQARLRPLGTEHAPPHPRPTPAAHRGRPDPAAVDGQPSGARGRAGARRRPARTGAPR